MTIIFSKKQKTIKDTIYLSGKVCIMEINQLFIYIHQILTME